MILLDASSGASGDMFLGALVDLGGDRSLLSEVEEVVPVEFEFERVTKAGVNSLKVNVLGGGDDANDDDAHRSYDEVVSLVEGARGGIPDAVVDDALSVFERIGRAEAEVHGVELDELDFHEVGADDAIADVLGVSLLLHDLGYPDEDAVVDTLSVGGGRVDAAHGSMPVPVPAVVEILKNTDHTTVGGPVDSELLTPTGAALVAEFTRPVDEPPRVNVDATGYGAGSKEFDHPNVLRAMVGKSAGGLR
ncbi:MAG: LarC family nickel insertion protein, partial [Halobacteria archaeon]|nr:LarC family nickel insertion protein [Halobacteria archaeon]